MKFGVGQSTPDFGGYFGLLQPVGVMDEGRRSCPSHMPLWYGTRWVESNVYRAVGASQTQPNEWESQRGQRLANAAANLGKQHRDESDNGPAAFRMRTQAGSTPGSDWKGEETQRLKRTR